MVDFVTITNDIKRSSNMFTWAKSSIYKTLFVTILLKCYTNASIEFVKTPSKTITAFPGESITIDCVIRGLTNDHVVEWAKGIDKDIVSQNHVILEDYKNSFTISQEKSDFSLSFTISTDNYENIDFYLSVIYNNEVTVLSSLSKLSVDWTIPAPVCAKFLNSDSASEGEKMRLMCQSSTVHETDIYYGWSKNGEIVSPGRLVYNLYEFFISKSDHNAEFICTATKYLTGETRTCSVDTFTVNYAPTVLVRHKSALVYECEVDARPSATPTWGIDPAIPLSSFNVEDYVTFFITDPDSVPIGATLSCTASNSEGVGSDIVKITKNEPTTIGPTSEDDDRLTIPYKHKSRDEGNNMIMIVGLVAGGFVIIAIIGIMFVCCKKNSKRQKEKSTPQTTVSYNNIETSNVSSESSQLELGTQVQRNKKDCPYEIIATNGSLSNGTSIKSARNRGAPNWNSSTPDGNSPKKSHGYTNIALNMGDSMENRMAITPRTNSNIMSPQSARNTVYATTNEHLSAMLDKKPESRITYASVVPKSKRIGKENVTKSIHTDFRISFSQATDEEAKISDTKMKQDPRLGYTKVIPKSKRNTNMINVTEDTKENCKEDYIIIEDQELSTIKKQNLRFGYTNVVPASERKGSEKKRARVSCDFLINDELSTGTHNKHDNDHNNAQKNNKITTRQDYTVVIPKSKRTTHGDKENNYSINKSKESRISYAEIDFSSMKQNAKTKKASKDSRVSYADIDFSHGNTRQNRKNYTPVIPKSQRNQDGMNNSHKNP